MIIDRIQNTNSKGDWIKNCLMHNLPFVAYSLPLSDEVTTIIQHKSIPRIVTNFSGLQHWKGFLIAPFDLHGEFPAFILEPDEVITSGHITDDLLLKLEISQPTYLSFDTTDNSKSTEKEEFKRQVISIKNEIDRGLFRKVVLSRILVKIFGNTPDPALVFDLIRFKYKATFRYIFNLPGIGCWMGASPEPFILNNRNSIEITSLAGTQKLNGAPLHDLAWNTKELTEQQYVTQYIKDALYKFKISDYALHGPVSFGATNVAHLKSAFQLNADKFEFNLGAFIEELHPSPSVAGIPKKEAIDFIQNLERHKREYYTGFLGPVNMQGQTNLFVNLRCMKLTDTKLILYAGAGITKDSDAAMEWEETNQKLQAMQNVLDE